MFNGYYNAGLLWSMGLHAMIESIEVLCLFCDLKRMGCCILVYHADK